MKAKTQSLEVAAYQPPHDNRLPQQVALAGDLTHPAKGRKRPETLSNSKRAGKSRRTSFRRVSRPCRRKEACFRFTLALRWTHPAEDRAIRGRNPSADLGAGGLTAPCSKAGEGKPSPAFLSCLDSNSFACSDARKNFSASARVFCCPFRRRDRASSIE